MNRVLAITSLSALLVAGCDGTGKDDSGRMGDSDVDTDADVDSDTDTDTGTRDGIHGSLGPEDADAVLEGAR